MVGKFRVVENIKADITDITTAVRNIVNRHVSSVRDLIRR